MTKLEKTISDFEAQQKRLHRAMKSGEISVNEYCDFIHQLAKKEVK